MRNLIYITSIFYLLSCQTNEDSLKFSSRVSSFPYPILLNGIVLISDEKDIYAFKIVNSDKNNLNLIYCKEEYEKYSNYHFLFQFSVEKLFEIKQDSNITGLVNLPFYEGIEISDNNDNTYSLIIRRFKSDRSLIWVATVPNKKFNEIDSFSNFISIKNLSLK